MGDLEGDEACLADVLTTVDPAMIYTGSREDASPRDAAKFETFMLSMFQCVPGLLEFAFDQPADAPMPTQ